MTPAERIRAWIAEREKRAERAAPGPWESQYCDYALGTPYDDDFIAHSRIDLPAALKALDRATEELRKQCICVPESRYPQNRFCDPCRALAAMAEALGGENG